MTTVIQWKVQDELASPNDGPEVERFKEDLRQLAQLFESGKDFYVCGARARGLLNPAAVIRWSRQQLSEIEQLRGLLHPKHMVASAGGLPSTARLVQGIFYAFGPHPKLNPLERTVLWRLSHLYPVLAFCELIVALGYPNQDSTPGSAPSPLGAAVAAKSALELTAHFVSGGKSGGCDPFDDATKFGYRDSLTRLGVEDDEWSNAPGWYDALCEALKGPPVDHERMCEICRSVLKLVLQIKEFQTPLSITPGMGRLDLLKFDQTESFAARNEPHVLLTYRTDYHECSWPTSPETVGRSMSWTQYNTPRLEALGFSQVRAFDSPVLVDMTDLMTKMDSLTESNANLEELLRNVNSLIYAFCVSCNLANILALGAIARQLHLEVEKLTEAADLCSPYEDRRQDESDAAWKIREPHEDDKSLKCIAEDLAERSTESTDLNSIRRALQNILQSFAHPGWLVRTELLNVREKLETPYQVMFITGSYTPRYMGRLRMVDGRETEIDIIQINFCANSHFSELSTAYPAVLRTALTGIPNGEITPGSAIDIPFVAFDLCRRALELVVRKIKWT